MTAASIPLHEIKVWHDGRQIPGTEIPDILEVVARGQQWIDLGERPAAQGAGSSWVAWPDDEEFVAHFGPLSLGNGSTGLAWYFLHAADVTGDDSLLDKAHAALAHVTTQWRDVLDEAPRVGPRHALSYDGGLAGAGLVVAHAARRWPDRYADSAVEILDHVLGEQRDGTWTGLGPVLGDGGIVLALVDAAEVLTGVVPGADRYLDAAVAAGERYLAQAVVGDDVRSWPGTPARTVGMDLDLDIHGFKLGNEGAAYIFGKLAVATERDDFRAAAVDAVGAAWAAVSQIGDSALMLGPEGTANFGYCTGVSGLIRSLVQVHHATDDPQLLEQALRLGRGIVRSGVPGRFTRANQFVYHQCCGRTSVLETLVGLYLESGDAQWLTAARTLADEIISHGIADAHGIRWYSSAVALPTGRLKAEVGYTYGVAGISFGLLRLLAVERAAADGTEHTSATLPDYPYRRAVPAAD